MREVLLKQHPSTAQVAFIPSLLHAVHVRCVGLRFGLAAKLVFLFRRDLRELALAIDAKRGDGRANGNDKKQDQG